ncbi:MAG: hypothetical protein HQK96_12370 [Nitrospirae bacterium]|nr:hypothetical protein [Nitrospirota bacterium]
MAVAIESIIKLIAFMSIGIFVTFFLYDGFDDIFNKFSCINKTKIFPRADASVWVTYFALSMSAILLLPRQFHVSVIENFKPRHILTAMWLFPLYLFLINIFVYPLALGGLTIGLPVKDADIFVLLLPKLGKIPWLTMFAFIGGFSAATSMVIVCSMTLSTMVTNHILLPIVIRIKLLNFVKGGLLYYKWVVVASCILFGYYLASVLDNVYLVPMGMISFAAVFQLIPSIVGGLFWSKGSKGGALLGVMLPKSQDIFSPQKR